MRARVKHDSNGSIDLMRCSVESESGPIVVVGKPSSDMLFGGQTKKYSTDSTQTTPMHSKNFVRGKGLLTEDDVE